MLAILIAHAVATALAPLLVYRWGRMAFYPLALVPLGSLVWVAANWPAPGGATTVDVPWVPELSMNFTLRFDSLAAIMSVLVLGNRRPRALLLRGLLPAPRRAHREAAAQLRRRAGRVLRCDVRPGDQRQHASALRVLGADDGVVVPARRPLRRARHQPPRRHPGVAGDDVRRAGDARRHHRAREHGGHLSALRTDRVAADGIAASVGVVLVLVGALSKSAIVPMHFWLPGAMAARHLSARIFTPRRWSRPASICWRG